MKTRNEYIKEIQQEVWSREPDHVFSDKEIFKIVRLAGEHEDVIRSIVGYTATEIADIILPLPIIPLEKIPQVIEMKRRWALYEHG